MPFIRWGIRLLIIHVFFIIIVWLASYFSPLDILATGAYLYLLWKAGSLITAETLDLAPSRRDALCAGLLAQSPGLLLAAANLYSFYDYTGPLFSDCRFAFQLWHTPFMPFLTFFSFPVWGGYSFCFWALNLGAPLYLTLLWLSANRTIIKSETRINQVFYHSN